MKNEIKFFKIEVSMMGKQQRLEVLVDPELITSLENFARENSQDIREAVVASITHYLAFQKANSEMRLIHNLAKSKSSREK
jgi:hypothetical protein